MEETEIEALVPAEAAEVTAPEAEVSKPTGLSKATSRESLFDLDNIRGTNLEILIASGIIDELSVFSYVGFDQVESSLDDEAIGFAIASPSNVDVLGSTLDSESIDV